MLTTTETPTPIERAAEVLWDTPTEELLSYEMQEDIARVALSAALDVDHLARDLHASDLLSDVMPWERLTLATKAGYVRQAERLRDRILGGGGR